MDILLTRMEIDSLMKALADSVESSWASFSLASRPKLAPSRCQAKSFSQPYGPNPQELKLFPSGFKTHFKSILKPVQPIKTPSLQWLWSPVAFGLSQVVPLVLRSFGGRAVSNAERGQRHGGAAARRQAATAVFVATGGGGDGGHLAKTGDAYLFHDIEDVGQIWSRIYRSWKDIVFRIVILKFCNVLGFGVGTFLQGLGEKRQGTYLLGDESSRIAGVWTCWAFLVIASHETLHVWCYKLLLLKIIKGGAHCPEEEKGTLFAPVAQSSQPNGTEATDTWTIQSASPIYHDTVQFVCHFLQFLHRFFLNWLAGSSHSFEEQACPIGHFQIQKHRKRNYLLHGKAAKIHSGVIQCRGCSRPSVQIGRTVNGVFGWFCYLTKNPWKHWTRSRTSLNTTAIWHRIGVSRMSRSPIFQIAAQGSQVFALGRDELMVICSELLGDGGLTVGLLEGLSWSNVCGVVGFRSSLEKWKGIKRYEKMK